MSANKNPSPSQVLAALRDYGVDVQTYSGWNSVGRPWKGPDGSTGLEGAVVHHTSTASATGSKGAPSLWWAVNAYELPVCNLLVGRGPGDTYLLAGGSAYHCGDGVTPKFLGSKRGFYGQSTLFGFEIDDPGTSTSSLTAYQIEQVGRSLAALADLCGWDIDKAVGTHKCYTDGCHGWQSKPNPTVSQNGTRGRKNDTLDGDWSEWPGESAAKPYNAPFWRREAQKYAKRKTLWDGTVPSRDAVLRSVESGRPNKGVWRLACRLYDLGVGEKPARNGQQTYPAKSVAEIQAKWGWKPTGVYSTKTERRIWNKAK